MQCPHCLEFFDRKPSPEKLGRDLRRDEDHGSGEAAIDEWKLPAYGFVKVNCTACGRLVVQLVTGIPHRTDRWDWQLHPPYSYRWVLPASPNRMRFATEIPSSFKQDYDEAVAVLPLSPGASAALSRRCLQNIIRNKVGIVKENLFKEIEELLKLGGLPTHLQEVLHPIRELGNLAAHPIKSAETSQIVPVDFTEADLCICAIESLFDFYFVQPAITRMRLEKVQAKIQDAKGNNDK